MIWGYFVYLCFFLCTFIPSHLCTFIPSQCSLSYFGALGVSHW